MLVVPLLPFRPCSKDEDIHKHFIPLVVPSLVDEVQPVTLRGPLDAQCIAASHTKGVKEEQVFHRFFRGVLTQQIVIAVILQIKRSPPQHIPGIESISQKEPAENLEFDGGFSFTDP